ncbi:outer membrane protein transport protein [Pseudomonas sp. KSR10]|jgi:long-chain fatty acid transport protein|uniref:Long-chain fatty acid transport protein n=1 Tax=Stutzerimonas stutzeri TaxID=316 RepID=A0A0D9AUU7_STUST|nr:MULTISPECIES: outer membrane protein transport protein [Pseudomonadaceae]KJH83161.1 Long-chain fatty acid transport protein [Stutzerimonas stutzeri]MCG6542327.1 outer membrane protein transport protein [Pseudomonas sp. KSR10]
MRTTWLKTAIAVAVGALSTQAMAAGFALNEQSISGMGTSFAGRSSSADDATTLFGNPAGMSRLKREEVSFGMAAINAKTDIKNASGAPGSNDGDMVPVTAVPMGYYVNPLDDKWAVGVGIYVPFGLITDYESGFSGRYHGDYSEVRVITVQPTVSYRFNEKLSVGFGPTINRIDGQLESAVPPVLGTSDSRVKIKGDDTALGFNVGVLYEFSPRTRAGVTYHSKVDYTLEGDTRVSGNDPALGFVGAYGKYDASLDLETPESIDFSLTHELNDQWTIYGGAMLTRWSRLETIMVENEGVAPGPASASFGTIEEEQDWHDTWSYALGAAYKLNKQWTLRTGLAFDQSPTNNTHRSPRIPTGDRTAVSFGLAWNPSDDVTVDLAYSYLWEEDAKIRQASYNATYENSAHGFGAAMTYRF